jgi:hypothetical protein
MARPPKPSATALEFYETPHTYTKFLFDAMARHGYPIRGRVFEPTVGSGAIVLAAESCPDGHPRRVWLTNDIDPKWGADINGDATQRQTWDRVVDRAGGPIQFVVGNPPFTPAIEIIDHALDVADVAVAMHLRISIHEVLKTGARRAWMHDNPPTGILFLPRFAYQRSKKSGKWTQDTTSACWVIWIKGAEQQFIEYAPPWVVEALKGETPAYRQRMDALMGVGA